MSHLSSPIIRVSRKRIADPQTALVVECKRQKNDQLLFSLFKTSDAPDIAVENVSNPVIDFRNEPNVPIGESDPLSFANNSINEIGGPEPQPSNPNDDVITVNGRPLVPAESKTDEDVVYDFYKIVRGDIESFENGFDNWNMRFATKEEALLVHADNDSSDDAADDDDDSNDENNWRNDYPDEEGDSEGDADDTESDRENDEEYSSNDEDDGLRLRMQRFGLGADENSDNDLDY